MFQDISSKKFFVKIFQTDRKISSPIHVVYSILKLFPWWLIFGWWLKADKKLSESRWLKSRLSVSANWQCPGMSAARTPHLTLAFLFCSFGSNTRGRVDCPGRAPYQLKEPFKDQRKGSWWKEQKRKIFSPMRLHWFTHKTNKWFLAKSQ